tara:strand:+ start:6209 stop:7141 length:933 start_codon:yes stop_codon:yes gene_type:complete
MNYIAEYEIITTVYNNEADIKPFLDQIAVQSLTPVRVIMVDGGSVDRTPKMVQALERSYPFEIKFLRSKERKNISEGFNIGIKASAAELLVLTAVGNSLSSSFCYNLVSTATSNSNVDVCYPKIIGEKNSILSILFNRYYLNTQQIAKMGPSNRGVLIRRDVFDTVGLFKENFYYAGEDTEFFIRCRRQGMRLEYNENAVVTWDVPRNIGELHRKLKVNAIADLQLFSTQWLIKHHFIFALLCFACIVTLIKFPLELLLLIFIIFSAASIYRGIDLLSILFGIYCKLLTVFFVCRFAKFRRRKYAVGRVV